MFDEINLTEILKHADKWGVQYKLNSESPGFYISENNEKKKVSLNELFLMEKLNVVDEVISVALNDMFTQPVNKMELDNPHWVASIIQPEVA